MLKADMAVARPDVSHALLKLWKPENEDVAAAWLNMAIDALDSYFTPGEESSVQKEPQVVKRFNGDLNGYLKWDQLGKTNDASPHLITLLSVTKAAIAHKVGQQPSLRDMVTAAIAG